MKDYLIRAISRDGKFRFHIVDSTGMVEESRRLHNSSTTATAAMGRLLTMATILGIDLEDEESVTLNIKGNGPGGFLVAVSDKSGTARVSAQHPELDIPSREDGHLDVSGWVGNEGTLSVVRGYHLKEPFMGITKLVSGEIAEDFASYFFHSEQTPTVVSLGVFVETDHTVAAAGGLFIQAMPGVTDSDLDTLEGAIADLDSMTNMIRSGMSPEDILNKYFSALEPRILDTIEVKYECNCSREKMEKALASIPYQDLQEMAEEDGGAEVVCEFCNEKYRFSADELIALGQDQT